MGMYYIYIEMLRYSEAVKLARDPDVQNEDLVKTFQRSFTAARKVVKFYTLNIWSTISDRVL